jgi:hypothetical protein
LKAASAWARCSASSKFSRNDPVYISVFNSLVEFIFFNIKCSKIIPLKFQCIFNALKTLQKCAIIKTITFWSISIRFKKLLVRSEHVVCLLSWAFKNYYHKASHQKCSIHHFIWFVRCTIMEYSILWIIFIS